MRHAIRRLPTRGPINIVGAGDCVTTNLTTALAGATRAERPHIRLIGPRTGLF